MYHVEAFIAQERWEQQGGTYDSPAAAEEVALAISRERQVNTRVRDEVVGWTRFEHLPGGIRLRRAYNRAVPEIHDTVRGWARVRIGLGDPLRACDVDLLVDNILRSITRELQEHS